MDSCICYGFVLPSKPAIVVTMNAAECRAQALEFARAVAIRESDQEVILDKLLSAVAVIKRDVTEDDLRSYIEESGIEISSNFKVVSNWVTWFNGAGVIDIQNRWSEDSLVNEETSELYHQSLVDGEMQDYTSSIIFTAMESQMQ